jgi:hypothetical protein
MCDLEDTRSTGEYSRSSFIDAWNAEYRAQPRAFTSLSIPTKHDASYGFGRRSKTDASKFLKSPPIIFPTT